MRMAFYGTSDRSTPLLEALNKDFELVLTITKTDTIVGRNKDIRQTEVKKWSLKNKVRVFETNNLKHDKEELKSLLQNLKVELAVVADFSFMLPKDLADTPPLNTINIHFSTLPALRGASPVQHAILQGLEESGITFYVVDEEMDTGDIISHIPYKINPQITAGEMYSEMFEIAAKNLKKVLEDYRSDPAKVQPQDHTKASYTYSKTNPKVTFILKEDALIDWSEPVLKIERSIRAYDPWPIAWTHLGSLENNTKISENLILKDQFKADLKLKIYSAKIEDSKLKLIDAQVEGKNKTDWESIKNGYFKII